MKTSHLLAALALTCAFNSEAVEPGKFQVVASPDQVPNGLEKSDWHNIREAHQAAKFRSALNAGLTIQQAYLKASNTGAGDWFGHSVAISGDTVIVGAPFEDSDATGVNGNQINSSASNSGAAYVFVRNAGIWSQQAYLKASNTGAEDEFGDSVAISGDTIVIGARFEDSNATGVNGNQINNSTWGSGAAYVFVRNAGIWSQQAYLKASNTGEYGDIFGDSVAVSGNTIVVGACGENNIGTGVNGNQNKYSAGDSGAAYVFVRNAETWSQQAYLKASNTGADDRFGISVAISGDTVVVGAVDEDSSATGVNGNQINNSASNSGAAYVFVRNAGIWSQQAYLKASNTEAGDKFGWAVAISGTTVVVGAYLEDSNATGVNGNQINVNAIASGAAYIFVQRAEAWSQQAYLKASNTGSGDNFGESVAISGDTVVVGALLEDSNVTGVNGNQINSSASDSGAAYVFVRNAGTWSQHAYLKASNTGAGDNFGWAVAISGTTMIVGAPFEDSISHGVNTEPNDAGTAVSSGAAYIFTFRESPPPVVRFNVRVKVDSKLGKVTGAGSFTKGSNATLKAMPKKGHKFLGWFEKTKLITRNKTLVIRNLNANRWLVAKFK